MDQWIFTREELHNALPTKDMTVEEEQSKRAEGCFFIQCVSYNLGVSQQIIATATVFFHRFYARRSFEQFELKYVSVACILIACKVEEWSPPKSWTPKEDWTPEEEKARKKKLITTLEAVIQASLNVRYRPEYRTEAPFVRFYKGKEGREAEEAKKVIIHWTQKVKKLELAVLETLCFDLSVSHPHEYVTEYAEQLKAPSYIVQAAWAFANDSLRQPLCLYYEPRLIAAACVYLAYKLRREWPSTMDTNWSHILESKTDSIILADIITELVSVYKILSSSSSSMHTQNGLPKPDGSKSNGSKSTGPNNGLSSRGAGNHEGLSDTTT